MLLVIKRLLSIIFFIFSESNLNRSNLTVYL